MFVYLLEHSRNTLNTLELVEDMTTKSFMCLRRFIARRGKPSLVISDYGSQIKLGDEVLQLVWKKSVKNDEILSYVSNEGINWKFINEYSPWKGGVYERLVGMVKRSLRKTWQRSKVTSQQLRTVISEI